MTIALLHLSDIHFRGDQTDLIAHRARALTSSVSPYLGECVALIPIISGDVAHSGLPVEYKVAQAWHAEVRNGLVQVLSGQAHVCDSVVVPGNHDCDFAREDDAQEVRSEFINNPGQIGVDVRDAVIRLCCTPQRGFTEFASAIRASTSTFPLHTCHAINQGGPIHIHAFNSAWMSQKYEKEGTLVFPLSVEDHILKANSGANLPGDAFPDVSVWLMHHPFNWFRPESAKRLRAIVEQVADIVVTGHEHEGGHYGRADHRLGSTVDYVEGCVLQDSAHAERSAFNLILLDRKRSVYRVLEFAFDHTQNVYAVNPDTLHAQPIPFRRNRRRTEGAFDYQSEALTELQDPGAVFSHPRVAIRLHHIYVAPDIQEIPLDPPSNSENESVPVGMIDYVLEKKRVVLIGAEKAGKSAAARYLMLELRKRSPNLIPILLSGLEVQLRDIGRVADIVSDRVGHYYGKNHVDLYWSRAASDRAIIIDDFHCLRLRAEQRSKLVAELQRIAGVIVLTCGEDQRLEYLTLGRDVDHPIIGYAHGELLPLGFLKRHVIVKAWYELGRDVNDEAVRIGLQREIRHAERTISDLINTDMVPSFPIIVLVWLQNMEAGRPIDTSAGSYGYLYYSLIVDRLRRLDDHGERSLDGRLSYLKELAWFLYDSLGSTHVGEEVLSQWHEEYRKRKRLAGYAFDSYVQGFVRVGLLRRSADTDLIEFCYPFIYYYFVAKALAEKLGEPEVQSLVERLSRNLHNEQTANIMIFLAHLSNGNPFVLNTMEAAANALLPHCGEWDSDRQCGFVSGLLSELPRLEASDESVEVNWNESLAARDRQETAVPDVFGEALPGDGDQGDDARLKSIMDINSVFKTVQIIGQVLRSYPGSLDGEMKARLMRACYRVMLRLLYLVFDEMQTSGSDAVTALVRHLKRTRPESKLHDLQSSAQSFLFILCERITFGVLRHLSEAVGSCVDELRQIYSDLLKENEKRTAYRLIDLAIKFDHFDKIPVEAAIQLFVQERKRQNRLTAGVVRDMAWYHMYIFDTAETTRQKLCDNLEIGKAGHRKLVQGRGRLLPPSAFRKKG